MKIIILRDVSAQVNFLPRKDEETEEFCMKLNKAGKSESKKRH